MKGVGEIHSPAIAVDCLADRSNAVDGKIFDGEHVLEQVSDFIRRHAIAAPQHPLEFLDHGYRHKELTARQQQGLGALSLCLGRCIGIDLSRNGTGKNVGVQGDHALPCFFATASPCNSSTERGLPRWSIRSNSTEAGFFSLALSARTRMPSPFGASSTRTRAPGARATCRQSSAGKTTCRLPERIMVLMAASCCSHRVNIR